MCGRVACQLADNIPMTMTKDTEWIDTANTPERRIIDLRTMGMHDALALGHLHYHAATKPLPMMCHSDWLVLVFMITGQQRYIIDGGEVLVRGGEVLRILPGTEYGTGPRPEQKGELAWLILKVAQPAAAPVLGMTAADSAEVVAMLEDRAAPLVLDLPDDARELIDAAFSWWEHKDTAMGREMLRNRIATLVLGVVARLAGKSDSSANRGNDLRIQRVLEWMHMHPDAQPNAGELAGIAGLSQASFFVHFKRITGCSPKDYAQRQRIELAAAALRAQPQCSITRVAHAHGFSSSQYFATVFRRYFGVSPADYRKG